MRSTEIGDLCNTIYDAEKIMRMNDRLLRVAVTWVYWMALVLAKYGEIMWPLYQITSSYNYYALTTCCMQMEYKFPLKSLLHEDVQRK